MMQPWVFNRLAHQYALSADWDNRWRTGGTLDEIIDEAHLSTQHLMNGILRFVNARADRLATLKKDIESAVY